jgi:hypothetical protein
LTATQREGILSLFTIYITLLIYPIRNEAGMEHFGIIDSILLQNESTETQIGAEDSRIAAIAIIA